MMGFVPMVVHVTHLKPVTGPGHHVTCRLDPLGALDVTGMGRAKLVHMTCCC